MRKCVSPETYLWRVCGNVKEGAIDFVFHVWERCVSTFWGFRCRVADWGVIGRTRVWSLHMWGWNDKRGCRLGTGMGGAFGCRMRAVCGLVYYHMVSMNAGLTLLKLLGIADGDVLVEGRRYSMLQVLEHCGIVHTKCYLSRVSMNSCSRIL
jgi:hypothetical protein